MKQLDSAHTDQVCNSLSDLPADLQSTSWAQQAVGEWQSVHLYKPKHAAPVTIRVKGIKSHDNTMKAVPRKKVLAAFVGRMNIETRDDLRKYLKDADWADGQFVMLIHKHQK